VPVPTTVDGFEVSTGWPTAGMSQMPGVPEATEPPPPQLSNSAALAISTALFGMFILLMLTAALNKVIFVAGSPSMSFLVIHFAPALQPGYFQEDQWNPVR
jgi:hypothetical protein